MLLRTTPRAASAELEVLAHRPRPGHRQPSAALERRTFDRGNAGIGLGAARRMSDEFDIYSGVPHGTVVLARIRPNAARRRAARVRLSGVSVAKAGRDRVRRCLDARYRPRRLLGVRRRRSRSWALRGAGGERRRRAPFAVGAAAAAARRRSRRSTTAIRHTRGAAAAIAELDAAAHVVDVRRRRQHRRRRSVDNGAIRHAVSHNGTSGIRRGTSANTRYPWPTDSLLVMHSDGLGTHWSLDELSRAVRSAIPPSSPACCTATSAGAATT